MSGIIQHGGDLSGFWSQNPEYTGPVLDLSTGINPQAFPVTDCDAAKWHKLPQQADEAALLKAAATYMSCASNHLLIAPGSQILISQLPYTVLNKTVQIMSPTYGEHTNCWQAAGHTVIHTRPDEGLRVEAEVCIITNPNNPDGFITKRNTIISHARSLAARDGMLVVDEAFADIAPEVSVTDLVDDLPIVVLRSFGKFFGLAGARIGFLVAGSEIKREFAQKFGPWAVSGPALDVATRAYLDQKWITDTRKELANQMERLINLMDKVGISHVGGTSLFGLFRHPDMARINQKLISAGIYARTFDYNPNWLRFGLPANDQDWSQLQTTLEQTQ